MGQQDFLKQCAKEICTFFENISDHCDIYEAICVCQQTQLSKEKMSCAEYDDKRKKNYIFKTEFLGPQKIITCCGGGGKSSKYLQHYHT